MAWRIEYDPGALKDLKKLGLPAQLAIVDYTDNRIASASNPRLCGKALRGVKFGLWRYRVGDYRIVCEIQDARMIVLVVVVGHRIKVYEPKSGIWHRL